MCAVEETNSSQGSVSCVVGSVSQEHNTMIPASTSAQSGLQHANHYTTAAWHMTFDMTNLSVTIATKLGNFLHKSDNMIDKLLLFAQHISSYCTLPATL